jgi:hypothetical protein
LTLSVIVGAILLGQALFLDGTQAFEGVVFLGFGWLLHRFARGLWDERAQLRKQRERLEDGTASF